MIIVFPWSEEVLGLERCDAGTTFFGSRPARHERAECSDPKVRIEPGHVADRARFDEI
jgi:hypothetical protein